MVRKRTVIIFFIIVIFIIFFVVKGRIFQPLRVDTEELAKWRTQKEIFVVSLPDSLIFDSAVKSVNRIGNELFTDNEIYKVQVLQKRLSGDFIMELTVGVNLRDKGTYILPADHNLMINKEQFNINQQSMALQLAEIYVNFTSDSHHLTRTIDKMNERFIVSTPSDISQSIQHPVPGALADVLHEPRINAVAGGTQHRMELFTWEGSTGNVEEWEIVIFFNGAVTASKTLIAERAGLYGL